MQGNKEIKTLIVEPTNHCNLRCAGCFNNSGMTRPRGFINIYLVKKLLDECTNLSKIIFHNWGEPFLWPEIFDAVEYASKKGIGEIYISTNATLFNEAMIDKIDNSGITVLQFSIDGVRKTYENIRGFPYKKVKQNILEFLEINAMSPHKKEIWISVCLDETTYREMENIRLEWEGLVDRVKYQPRQYEVPGKIEKPCKWILGEKFAQGVVLWDGRVTVCCSDFNGELCIGDANRNTLKEILNSDQMEMLRHAHLTYQFPVRCKTCSEFRRGKDAGDFWK